MDLLETHVFDLFLHTFNELTENPEIYIGQQLEKSEKFKELTKDIYDLTVSTNTLTGLRSKALSKLLYKGFDNEQIFQQIELLNTSFLSSEFFTQSIEDIKLINQTSPRQPAADREAFSDHDSNAEEEYSFDDESDSSTKLVKSIKSKPGSDSNSSTELVKSVENKSTSDKKLKPYSSKLDDQFFKLSKLEEFLKIEDIKEEKDYIDASDDDNDINLFQDIPSDSIDECEGSNEEKVKKSSKDLMYEDFFDSPDSGDENIRRHEDHMDNSGEDEKSDQYSEGESSVDLKEDEEDENIQMDIDAQNFTDDKNNQKSTFELHQEEINKKIAECEKSMVEPLPWHLTGEVDASNRPIDSLVHFEADFDSNVKKDLVVDSTLNERTENIITMAVINKAFCDVERKVKPINEVIAYKKELDQAKSKKSLAEVYEEDYLKRQSKQEEEENPKHKELKKLFDSAEYDYLCFFSDMPKAAVPEIKIVSNLPAITVEEVAPTSVSDVTMLAPEEVKKRSGLVKGKTERTDTDRKRERRKKKVHQKLKEKKRQDKLESQKANPSSKLSKLEKLNTLKKLKQHKNTKIATVDDGGKIKSSKDFFSRLQDTMESKSKTKNQVSFKKKK